MSCIVGIEHVGKVYLGADSCASRDFEIRIRRDKKIFKNHFFIAGYSGSVRPGQCLDNFKWTSSKKINKKSTIFDLVDYIRHLFRLECVIRNDNGADVVDSELLIGYKGVLYEIGGDFQIINNVDGYSAIGSGAKYALGSLYETQMSGDFNDNPEERIIHALTVSSYFDASVVGPFYIDSF